MNEDRAITYLLRCHNVSALPKLKNALQSISEQTYADVRALVVLQDLAENEVRQFDLAISKLRDECSLDAWLRNFSFPAPGDHRGALLNLGLQTVSTRYAAFLDYDDIVFPSHAETLISDLAQSVDSSAVASFGGCTLAFYDDGEDGKIHVTERRVFSMHPSVLSCLSTNCFPIHSYVLDLHRMQRMPRFDEESHLHEDYVFLLDLFESYSVSTRLSQICLCEYRINNNNSNTVSLRNKKNRRDSAKDEVWSRDQERVERKKFGRSFRVPYSEVAEFGDILILSRQPFLRGLLVCHLAKTIRKKHGAEEARKFLINPKAYSRTITAEKRSFLMRLFF